MTSPPPSAEPATVELALPHHRYEVRIGSGLLGSLGPLTAQHAPHDRAALLCDQAVATNHAPPALASLRAAGIEPTFIEVPSGEQHKTLETVADLYEKLLDAKLERKSPVIALGGGVIGDMAGFVAATYLRGVPFVQCPTTLLAMVDASVGGKTGVNLSRGKNLVGAFHQPALVAIDTDTLKTLPMRELRCGLAECVKHGVIRDPELFAWIEVNAEPILTQDPPTLIELVRRNVAIKAAVVMQDEKESGVRAHLNFGHTFAHAIEAIHGYGRCLHGEAVALGMLAATRLAESIGLCQAGLSVKLRGLLSRLGLPTAEPELPPTEALIEAMKLDKKVAGDRLRLVLPTQLGVVRIVDDAPIQSVANAWESLRGVETEGGS